MKLYKISTEGQIFIYKYILHLNIELNLYYLYQMKRYFIKSKKRTNHQVPTAVQQPWSPQILGSPQQWNMTFSIT